MEADRNRKNKRKLEGFDEIYIESDDPTEFGLSHFLETSSDSNNNHWSSINVKCYDDKVFLSKDDFNLLMKKINEMQKDIGKYEKNIRN